MVKRVAGVDQTRSNARSGGCHAATICRVNGRVSAAVIQGGLDPVLGRGIAEITEAGRPALHAPTAPSPDAGGMVQPGGTTGPRAGDGLLLARFYRWPNEGMNRHEQQ